MERLRYGWDGRGSSREAKGQPEAQQEPEVQWTTLGALGAEVVYGLGAKGSFEHLERYRECGTWDLGKSSCLGWGGRVVEGWKPVGRQIMNGCARAEIAGLWGPT